MTTKRKDRKFWRMGTNGKMVETAKHHCESPYCRGVVNRRTEHSSICTTCRWRRWKAANPLRYSFGNLRRRAKQRGHAFTLTFEEYKEFAERTDYARMKGKTSLSLSIDRIENSLGYHFWNIRALQLASNARKSLVPYFNGGMMPEIEREKYLELERQYNEPLEKIAAKLGQSMGFGTPPFWEAFNKRKLAIFNEDAASVC